MDKEEMRKKFRRPMGAVLILLSGIEAKYFIFDVLDKFRSAHDATMSYHEKGIYLPPLTFMLGLLMLIASPEQLKGFRSDDRKITMKGWILVIATLAVGFATNEWFKGEVQKAGYSSSDSLELRPVENKSSGQSEQEK